MAPMPTSMWDFRDRILPAVYTLCAIHEIVMDIWWAPATDCLFVYARSRNGLLKYNAALLTRTEIEDGKIGGNGNWVFLVRQRLAIAVNAVKAQASDPFAEEYDEIMKAQDLMEG